MSTRQKTPRDAGARSRSHPARGLDGVVGHQLALGALRHQLMAGQLSHAYWVSGPPQVGKTTLALALASEFLGADGWPGGLALHPDLWLEDGAGSISIDRIRAHGADQEAEQGPSLQHFLSLSAFAGRGKVAVVGNAERLSLPAANSLLRLLEEPTPDTMIWLCTSRPESEHLPNTLRSRCQQLPLGPVDSAAIADWLLKEHGVGAEPSRVAAAICLGRPGLGLELAHDRGLGQRAGQQLERFIALAGQGPREWLELSRELAERGTDREVARSALRVWASFLRDCCCLAVGAPGLCRWPEQRARADEWADRLGPDGCSRRYDLALDGLSRLDEMATPRLVLDRLLLLTFGEEPMGVHEGDRSAAAPIMR
ncbi:MAG: ATP-binding protein [Candidatus Dormibacteria bacterium]